TIVKFRNELIILFVRDHASDIDFEVLLVVSGPVRVNLTHGKMVQRRFPYLLELSPLIPELFRQMRNHFFRAMEYLAFYVQFAIQASSSSAEFFSCWIKVFQRIWFVAGRCLQFLE